MVGQREQRIVLYTGHVQGVGFRYATRNLASGFDVTGYVKNLPDGRVELVAEGTKAELNAFLEDIRQHFAGQIQKETIDTRPPAAHFSRFEIQH